MNARIFALVILVPLVTVACSSEPIVSEPESTGFVIRNVRIFDGQQVVPETEILVEDGVIAAVGQAGELPTAATEIDGSGQTLLPGLIDSHTHMPIEPFMRQAVVFGVTTQLDMHGDPEVVAAAKAFLGTEAGGQVADLFAATVGVTVPGGHGTQFGEFLLHGFARSSDPPGAARPPAPRLDTDGSTARGRSRDTPASPTRATGGGCAPPSAGVGAGSEVSRGHLFENRVVERLVCHQLLQLGVLSLEGLQPLGLVETQAAVFLPPPIVRLLADPERLTDLRRPQASAELHFRVPKLRDDLFRGIPLPGHPASCLLRPNSNARAGSVSGGKVNHLFIYS